MSNQATPEIYPNCIDMQILSKHKSIQTKESQSYANYIEVATRKPPSSEISAWMGNLPLIELPGANNKSTETSNRGKEKPTSSISRNKKHMCNQATPESYSNIVLICKCLANINQHRQYTKLCKSH